MDYFFREAMTSMKLKHDPTEMYEKVQDLVPDGRLFFYANNDPVLNVATFNCKWNWWLCLETKEQIDFLRSRGGNKTFAKTQGF